MRKINPLNDFLLIKRDPPKEVTEGGLYIPDVAKDKLTIGEIMAAGPGKMLDNGKRKEPSVKKGDRVIFGKYSGNEFELDGEKNLILMREQDIYGMVEG